MRASLRGWAPGPHAHWQRANPRMVMPTLESDAARWKGRDGVSARDFPDMDAWETAGAAGFPTISHMFTFLYDPVANRFFYDLYDPVAFHEEINKESADETWHVNYQKDIDLLMVYARSAGAGNGPGTVPSQPYNHKAQVAKMVETLFDKGYVGSRTKISLGTGNDYALGDFLSEAVWPNVAINSAIRKAAGR